MWTRAELKSKAKLCLKRYYWAALAVTFIVGLLAGGGSGAGGAGATASNGANQSQLGSPLSNPDDAGLYLGMAAIILVITLIVGVIGLIFRIFVGNVIIIGGKRFFMESRAVQRSAGVGQLFYAFSSGHYLNVVKTMFLKDLFVSLWTLLLIVPGLIKAYEYYMVPYILSENPDMNYKDAMRLSKEMMDGNKWNTFVLELSFFGWYLLGILACCIGMIFVEPYVEATVAELYAVLRRNVGAVGLNGFGVEEIYDHVVSEQ